MKRILIDPNDSLSTSFIQQVAESKKRSSTQQNNLKVSVVTASNIMDILKKRSSQKQRRRSKEECQTDNDEDSQRTRSLNKNKNIAKMKNIQISTSLQSQTQIVKNPTDSISIPPSTIPQISLQEFKERHRKRKNEGQSKEFNLSFQTYIIDKKLMAGQNELTISNTKIYFPYEPYKVQIQYMKQVIDTLSRKGNAILQSPTGTGKTLCLLASVLSFVEKQYKEQKIKHNVIYMSRTHSQLKQVQKELSKTCYRPNMAIFASRDQLCLKDNLSALRGNQKIQACGKGVKLAKKMRKDLKKETDNKVLQAACYYYKEREEVVMIAKRKLANSLLDIEIMKEKGREEMFCPYFYPIQTKDFTNLFIMPYNYLLDAYLLSNYQEIIENSIIIFDEAHNISQAACQGRSLILETHRFDSALLELNKLLSNFLPSSLQLVRDRFQKQIKCLVRMIEDWKESFNIFIEDFYSREVGQGQRESGRDESQSRVINKERTDQALFELFCGHISDERRREFGERKEYYRSTMVGKLINPIQEFCAYGMALIEDLKETADGVFSNFERILIFATKVKALLAARVYKKDSNWLEDEFNHFRVHLNRSMGMNGLSYTVGLKCLVPWLTFRDIECFKPRSILLTSGTLKPIQMWEKELRLRFPIQLVNKHVINDEQIAARVIRVGPSKIPFTFTFENINKNKNEIFKDLIEFLINSCSNIPNGVLLVFPSFKVQMDFKFELMRSSKKERLLSVKDIIFEEKSSDINMNDFRKKALGGKGAILAIICRGKVSQGIDFPDGMCRAVFIVGVPFPNTKDPFIMEKRNHLENISSRCDRKDSLSGDEWYMNSTVRAINQALGRVIRHAKDYGMIFLLDNRYAEKRMSKELPEWITQSMQVVDTLQSSFYDSIKQFYIKMASKYRQPKQYFKDQAEYKIEEVKQQKNAMKILMGNRKKMNMKKIPNSAFDF